MNEARRTDFLGTEPMFPLLLRMAVPAAVGMMVNALYNVVDTVFVGQGVGAMGIAALSIVFPIQMIASAFAQAIGVGTASVVSRRLGERRPDEAARAIGTAYAFTFAATAAVIAALYLFMEPVLGFFGASEGIMPYARRYLEVVAAGFFFFALSMCASSLLRAEGHARASMTGMLLG
ncbi:MAG TPA: MATE family efflux transporter, partial [Candidatus Hydrogenedentes bacterium]|nr:MATE family efflux transporter [Candidatus Hydrogenedentota bacterium]